MASIEHLAPAEFEAYLQQYDNTICGRHPIAILLHVRCALCFTHPHRCAGQSAAQRPRLAQIPAVGQCVTANE